MHTLTRAPRLALALSLALLMAATRSRHFGGLLPDASLAVFLLGGFYLARAGWFAAYLALAALVDQFAIRVGGVSDWCLTPAYAFLVPAYGLAWLAGRWAADGFDTKAGAVLARTLAAFAAGVFGWFVVSNAGFYLYSGYFDEMTAADYASRVARYLVPYAAAAALYVLLAAAVHAAAATWAALRRA